MAARAITVAVTRPRGVDSALATKLEAVGIKVLDCALTQIAPASEQDIAHARQLMAVANAVVLVSPQAVKAALARMPETLRGKCVAVMGPGSRMALLAGGVLAEQIIESATQDGLGLHADLLAALSAGARVVIARAQDGRDDLAQALRASGIKVEFATLYRRDPVDWAPQVWADLQRAVQADLRVLFTTSSAPEAFVNRLSAHDVALKAAVVAHAQAHCSHANVARAAREVGFGQVLTHVGDETTWLASLQSVHAGT